MKNNILISALLIFAVAAAVFFVDYILIALIGVFADMFNAHSSFYENVYPYFIALIISASIAYPISIVLMKNKEENRAKTLPIKHKHKLDKYKQSA
jgi:hypothetical protein